MSPSFIRFASSAKEDIDPWAGLWEAMPSLREASPTAVLYPSGSPPEYEKPFGGLRSDPRTAINPSRSIQMCKDL